jgi:hypothetical protein
MTGKYTNPVQFSDSRIATQIVNAANTLADCTHTITMLRCSYDIWPSADTCKKINELKQARDLIEKDIRLLAKGTEIV